MKMTDVKWGDRLESILSADLQLQKEWEESMKEMIKKTAKIVKRLRDEQEAKILLEWLPYILDPKKNEPKGGNVIVYNRLAKIKK